MPAAAFSGVRSGRGARPDGFGPCRPVPFASIPARTAQFGVPSAYLLSGKAARGRQRRNRVPDRSFSLLLAGLPAVAGATLPHSLQGMGGAPIAAPRQFDHIVPRSLPGSPRTWTYASGAAELAPAAGVALPQTRKVVAQATAAFFVGVFPAHVKMAVDRNRRPAADRGLGAAAPAGAPGAGGARSRQGGGGPAVSGRPRRR